ncbi:MAG: hypothetical protein AAFY48_05985 [Bacteroidota bacterium]
MVKFHLSLLFVSFLVFRLNAQCPTGDVILNSQAAVDEFVASYPNCTTLPGNLQIGLLNSSDADLSDLSIINEVEGDLHIGNNDGLSNLQGLNNITYVGGLVYIGFNDALTSLEGLNGLSTVVEEVSLLLVLMCK